MTPHCQLPIGHPAKPRRPRRLLDLFSLSSPAAPRLHVRRMALPLPPGIVPTEVAFLCEMEQVTVVPRQRLDPIRLLGGETPALRPPHRAVLPLWLALLLKRQRRASIVPPPWLHPSSLQEFVRLETRATDPDDPDSLLLASPPPPPPARADGWGNVRRVAPVSPAGTVVSPPFLPSATADAPADYLPYHWFELAEILLAHAPDDLPAPAGDVRALLRDLAEARAAKIRQLTARGQYNLQGIGAMEVAESRGLMLAMQNGMRRLGAAAEASRREEEELAEGGTGGGGHYDDDDEDDDMEL